MMNNAAPFDAARNPFADQSNFSWKVPVTNGFTNTTSQAFATGVAENKPVKGIGGKKRVGGKKKKGTNVFPLAPEQPKYTFTAPTSFKTSTPDLHEALLNATKGRRRFNEAQRDVHSKNVHPTFSFQPPVPDSSIPTSTDSLNQAFQNFTVDSSRGKENPITQNLNTTFESIHTAGNPFKAKEEDRMDISVTPKAVKFQFAAPPQVSAKKVTRKTVPKRNTPRKKKPTYGLCTQHKKNAQISTTGPVTSSCRDCSATFSTIFVDANLCPNCFAQSSACPIAKCKCTIVDCQCATTVPTTGTRRRVVQAQKPDRWSWDIFREAARKFYQKGEYEQAIKHYTDGITAIPKEDVKSLALMYTNRAAAQMMLNSVSQAIQDCIESICFDPMYWKAYIRIAKCYIMLGQPQQGLNYLNQINSRDESIRLQARDTFLDAERLTDDMKDVEKYLASGDYGSVLNATEAALKYATQCRVLQEQKIMALFELQRYATLASFCDDVVKQHPIPTASKASIFGVRATVLLARAKRYLERSDEAQSLLSELESVAPQSSTVNQLGRLWRDMDRYKDSGNDAFKAGRFFDAYQLYSEALELDEKYYRYCAVIYCNRAATSMAIGDYERAVSDCDDALLRYSTYPKARLRRARCYVELKKFDLAVVDFDRYLKGMNNPQVLLERHHANAALKKQQRQERQQRQQQRSSYHRYAWDDSTQDSWNDFFSSNRRPSSSQKKKQQQQKKKITPTKHNTRSHYEILGLTREATLTEIKKSYRKLALKYHPDKSNDPRYVELFKDMTAAYTILSDPDSKRKYDQELKYAGYGVYYEY